jgi:cation diffusion facilitator CzcD-associated flavoprotein CzcO
VSEVTHHEIAIVGAGFGGLGTAIQLQEEGRGDFVILERAEDIGGTWHANTYPGCQCDVPSNLYSFSFAPNPDWSHTFPMQAEIQAYLRRVADEHGLRPRIRFGCELTGAAWDEGSGLWRIETSTGSLTARVLVAAMGGLSEPRIPDLPGLDSFEDAAFHTANWDHERDFTGRRVAVVGTGASAIQVVPQLQPEVGQLTVFQRTPAWVFPHPGRPVRPRERALYRAFPPAQKAVRTGVYWGREIFLLPFRWRAFRWIPKLIASRHLADQVQDPELRAKLTPDFDVGCKRILLSDDYYPALQRPNVELVTEAVVEVRPRGVVTADGREYEVDTIVWGTGFRAADHPIAERLRGRDGALLADVWRRRGMSALRGTTFAGFPNLFMLVGPNTGLGHTSIILMIESQLAYLMDALRTMDERRLSAVEPRAEAQEAFNAGVQRSMKGSVWTDGGCASWYLDEHGANRVIWPGTTFAFRAATSRFDPGEYEATPA